LEERAGGQMEVGGKDFVDAALKSLEGRRFFLIGEKTG